MLSVELINMGVGVRKVPMMFHVLFEGPRKYWFSLGWIVL